MAAWLLSLPDDHPFKTQDLLTKGEVFPALLMIALLHDILEDSTIIQSLTPAKSDRKKTITLSVTKIQDLRNTILTSIENIFDGTMLKEFIPEGIRLLTNPAEVNNDEPSAEKKIAIFIELLKEAGKKKTSPKVGFMTNRYIKYLIVIKILDRMNNLKSDYEKYLKLYSVNKPITEKQFQKLKRKRQKLDAFFNILHEKYLTLGKRRKKNFASLIEAKKKLKDEFSSLIEEFKKGPFAPVTPKDKFKTELTRLNFNLDN
jgi:hypothetical protein